MNTWIIMFREEAIGSGRVASATLDYTRKACDLDLTLRLRARFLGPKSTF